jgi:hypothetical protein
METTAIRNGYSKVIAFRSACSVDVEQATVDRESAMLVAQGHSGHFALIRGSKIVGVRAASDEAILEGLRQFGDREPFLVARIEARASLRQAG